MKQPKPIFLTILITAMFLITACEEQPANIDKTPVSNECSEDSDCIKATCCHADSCIPTDQAPDCSGTMCTMNCEPGTLDCGQGNCKCTNDKCEAVFN